MEILFFFLILLLVSPMILIIVLALFGDIINHAIKIRKSRK